MKFVVACCWSPDMGQGISTISREIAASLAKQGDEVYYLSPETEDLSWYDENIITPIFIGSELQPDEGLIAVASSINKLRPDAVINNDHPYVQAALPLLHTRRMIICHSMAWGTAALARYNHQWSDDIIVISHDMLLMLLDKGVSPAKLSLIMNGVKDPHDEEWTPIQNYNQPINLIFAGGSSKNKGADLLLEFIHEFPDDTSWLELNIFGRIQERYANKIAGKPWVKVHGRVSHKQFAASLANTDVLIFPSKREGCPMTVIEAMSRGVVPIVSDGRGAMRWMVDHGVDGYIARRKHWKKDLCGILEHLHHNRDFLYAMKLQARKRYKKQFDICDMIERIKRIASQGQDAINSTKGAYQAIYWHRPSSAKRCLTKKIVDKFYYKSGILRKSGQVQKYEETRDDVP